MAHHESAPMLAFEEQARGDALVDRIGERQHTGGDVSLHQLAAQNAYRNAARYSEQPEGWGR